MAAWAPGMSVRSCGVLTWPRSSSGWPAHCTFRIGSTGSIRVLGSGGTARLVGLKHGKSVTSRAFIPLSVRAFEPRCPFAASSTSPSAHRHQTLDTKMAVNLHGQRAPVCVTKPTRRGQNLTFWAICWLCSFRRCPYIFMASAPPSLCPSQRETVEISTPDSMHLVANKWRMSWCVRRGIPISLHARASASLQCRYSLGECGSLPNEPSCSFIRVKRFSMSGKIRNPAGFAVLCCCDRIAAQR